MFQLEGYQPKVNIHPYDFTRLERWAADICGELPNLDETPDFAQIENEYTRLSAWLAWFKKLIRKNKSTRLAGQGKRKAKTNNPNGRPGKVDYEQKLAAQAWEKFQEAKSNGGPSSFEDYILEYDEDKYLDIQDMSSVEAQRHAHNFRRRKKPK